MPPSPPLQHTNKIHWRQTPYGMGAIHASQSDIIQCQWCTYNAVHNNRFAKKANEFWDGFGDERFQCNGVRRKMRAGKKAKTIGPKGIWGEISIQINQNYVTQKLNMFSVKLNSSSAHWFSLHYCFFPHLAHSICFVFTSDSICSFFVGITTPSRVCVKFNSTIRRCSVHTQTHTTMCCTHVAHLFPVHVS